MTANCDLFRQKAKQYKNKELLSFKNLKFPTKYLFKEMLMNTLTLAAIERNKKWMATLPENPPEVEFSEKHIKNMEILLDKMRGDRYHRFTRKTTRVIIAAAVIMALMTVTVFATTDLGAYILDELSDHAIFQSLFESEETVDGKIECGYVPDGFEVTEKYYSSDQYTLVYENMNGEHFSIVKMENGDEMGVDNEYTQKSVLQISDSELIIYEKDNGDIRAVWCNANYTYRLDGNILYEEVIKIAENVK